MNDNGIIEFNMDDYNKKMKNNNKIAILVVCVLLAAAVGVGGFFAWQNFFNQTDYVNRIITALENNEHIEARQIFEDNKHEIDVEALRYAVSMRLDELKNEFINEVIDYNMASRELSTVSGWQIRQLDRQIEELNIFMQTLNNSRTAFSFAEIHYAQGNFLEAINYFETVWPYDPNYYNAQNGLNMAFEGFRRSALELAESYAMAGDFNRAVFVMNNALDIFGNEADLVTMREEYAKQQTTQSITTQINETKEVLSNGNFNGAITQLVILDALHPNNPEIHNAMELVETSHINFILERVENLATDGRFEEAVVTLNEGISFYPNSVVLNDIFSNIGHEHVNQIISQAIEYVNNFQLDIATSLLFEGIFIYQSNAASTTSLDLIMILSNATVEVKEIYASLQVTQPPTTPSQPLRPLFPTASAFTGSGMVPSAVTVYIQGTQFPSSIRTTNDPSPTLAVTGWNDRNLNGQFNTITGTIGRIDGSGTVDSVISFIGDGVELASFTVGENNAIQNISVDVRGISILRIQMAQPQNGAWVAFTNAMIY